MSEHISCKEMIEFLGDYFAGELPEPMVKEFKRHLDVCPPCVNYLKAYEQTIKLGKACCEEERPPPIPKELVQAILAARAKG